jgi:hypothetical protein
MLTFSLPGRCQRILGTCLGGFNAWLGIIVCSWSYDDAAPINPYGLAVWLTVSTMLSAYFLSLASGVAAHFGSNKDHGKQCHISIFTAFR